MLILRVSGYHQWKPPLDFYYSNLLYLSKTF